MLRRSPLQNRDRLPNILPFLETGNRDIIAADIPYKVMTSAVLDRVLAIPDYDLDRPQMGLSNNSWAIVAATGKTKDGSPAKASVLKQERKGVSQEDIKKAGEKVGIKGDRKLPSKPVNKFEEKLRSQFKDRADAIKSKPEQFNKNFLAKQMADAVDNEKSVLIDSVIPKIRSGNKRLTTKAKGGKTFEGGVKGVGRDSSVRRKKRAMTDRDIARNAGIAAAKLESQGQLNLFNQPKQSAAIAPDTAKKVKRAIAGVKGGKVTQSPKAKATRKVKAIASQFVTSKSKNHSVFYNGKVVDMAKEGRSSKDEFKLGGMRISDNGATGFIKTPKGEYYKVSSSNRSAKKVSAKEVLASVR